MDWATFAIALVGGLGVTLTTFGLLAADRRRDAIVVEAAAGAVEAMRQATGGNARAQVPSAGPEPSIDAWLEQLRDGFTRYPWSIVFYEREVARHLALWSDPPAHDEKHKRLALVGGRREDRVEVWPPRAIDGSYVEACALCGGPAVSTCPAQFETACRACTEAEIAAEGPERFFWSGMDRSSYKDHDEHRRRLENECGSDCSDNDARHKAVRLARQRAKAEAEERDAVEGALTRVG